jgi:hypothetical protein
MHQDDAKKKTMHQNKHQGNQELKPRHTQKILKNQSFNLAHHNSAYQGKTKGPDFYKLLIYKQMQTWHGTCKV